MTRKYTNRMMGIVLVLLLFLTGCTGHENQAPIYDGWQQPAASKSLHRVQKGETLYSIAWNYGFDYRQIAKVNKIPSPYSVKVGQQLYLPPKSELKKTLKNNELNINFHDKGTKSRIYLSKEGRGKGKEVVSQVWRRPAKGKIIKPFAQSGSPGRRNKGIDIAGVYGDNIYASRSGEVVYSGDGLPGYGNLIIIKHDDTYLSAYAHNRRNEVKEGAKVKVGQKIAEMGSTGADRIMLHFEIRRAGKPVDPQNYLPG